MYSDLSRDLQTKVDQARTDATLAFWKVVAESFPDIRTGNMDPSSIFDQIEEDGERIARWVQYNAPTRPGESTEAAIERHATERRGGAEHVATFSEPGIAPEGSKMFERRIFDPPVNVRDGETLEQAIARQKQEAGPLGEPERRTWSYMVEGVHGSDIQMAHSWEPYGLVSNEGIMYVLLRQQKGGSHD